MRVKEKPHIYYHDGRWCWSVSHCRDMMMVSAMGKAAAYCTKANIKARAHLCD